MLGWIFGGLVKKLERSAKRVERDFVDRSAKKLNKLANDLDYMVAKRTDKVMNRMERLENKTVQDINEIIDQTTKKVDYMVAKRTDKVMNRMERLENKTVQDINEIIDQTTKKVDYMVAKRTDKVMNRMERLENKTVQDINEIIDQTDEKVKENLGEIDRIRRETIEEVNQTIQETDYYLENRINQISLIVMESIVETKDLIRDLELLETQVFDDAGYLIDQIEEIVDKTIEQVRGELRRHSAELIPNPLDPCRQKLGLGLKLGFQLSDIEYYRLIECYELTKLTPNTRVQTIIETYGQLQLNAARMVALTRKAPELRKFAVEDWLKYGVLCQFWSNTIKIYDSTELEIESSPSPQQFNYQELQTKLIESISSLQQKFSKPTD